MVVLDAKPLGLLVDVADHFLVAHLRLELDPLVAVHAVDLATRVYQAGYRSTDLLDLDLRGWIGLRSFCSLTLGRRSALFVFGL